MKTLNWRRTPEDAAELLLRDARKAAVRAETLDRRIPEVESERDLAAQELATVEAAVLADLERTGAVDEAAFVRLAEQAAEAARLDAELASVEGKAAMAKDIALVINAIIEPQLTAIFILQQEPSTADLRNLERLGAIPKETAGGGSYSAVAKEAAAQFWKVTEMDLPVQAVLFNALVMQ